MAWILDRAEHQWKTQIEEKTVIVKLGESQPWIPEFGKQKVQNFYLSIIQISAAARKDTKTRKKQIKERKIQSGCKH